MLDSDEKGRIIEILREAPFISHAAKKIGVSRSTIYRWQEGDPLFREGVHLALDEGRKMLSDIAESKLVKMIEKENLGAIKYFLSHNDRRYFNRSFRTELIKDLQPGETCNSCGMMNPYSMSREQMLWTLEDMAPFLGVEIIRKPGTEDLETGDQNNETKK
jgi:transposase